MMHPIDFWVNRSRSWSIGDLTINVIHLLPWNSTHKLTGSPECSFDLGIKRSGSRPWNIVHLKWSPNHKTHPMCQGYSMYIQRPERVFVTRFLYIFDVNTCITCSKLNNHCGSVFKVDSFLNCISNALPKLHEFKVDSTPLQTPLHSTTPFHDSTP